MPSKKIFVLLVAVPVLVSVLSLSARGSVSEIRRNFFEQTANLPATAIMSGPTGEDGSYLIAIYESSTSAAVPTLRWTDENDVAQSQTASCVNLCQILAFIRVKSGTQATVETANYSGPAPYSLYVSGLGFWRTGLQRQAGLGEATGIAVTDKLIYTATASISALLVAYVESSQGQQSVTWWDEDGQRTAAIPFGSPLVVPIRIAGGTGVRVYDITQSKTHVWYGLILFGAPGPGSGPFTDYEYDMLNWTNASYPNFETVFTNGASPASVLIATNFAEVSNSGSVEEGFNVTGIGTVNPSPCPNGLLAGTEGIPVGCVLPFTVLPNTALQVRTINEKGSPWGHSPTYSAEVDVLQF
jgi:hypothetical protein